MIELRFPDDDLDRLADRIAERLGQRLTPPAPGADSWLTTAQAAEHLGVSVSTMKRLVAAREVPFEQDGPGARCFFRREDLDAWRRRA